jgi:hypothetical protein
MQERIDEINHALQNIHRNLALMITTDSPRDLRIVVEQGQQGVEEWEAYNFKEIKKQIQE